MILCMVGLGKPSLKVKNTGIRSQKLERSGREAHLPSKLQP